MLAKSTIHRDLPTVTADMRCGAVFQVMQQCEGGPALAVLDETDRPTGLIARQTLLQAFAHPVTYALYENRPVRLLMNRDPLIVEADQTIDQLSELIANDQPDAIDEGFVVVEGSRYLGIGTVLQLLDRSVERARTQIAELETARAAAEHANRTKSAFLANMSHELRTPLNAVLGFTDLLASGTAGAVSDRQAEYLRDIQMSGRRLLDLINDLLDLSRAESGRLDVAEEQVDPAGLIAEVQRMLAPRAKAAGVELRSEPGIGDQIRGDERKLLQVLVNLATNAVKFTPQGGSVTVGVDRTADGGTTLWVRDTGVGIPQAELDTVLAPFGRGHGAMVRQIEGSGIGLALTRVLVELHGGRFVLDSTAGQGTMAQACLPVERTLLADADASMPEARHAGGRGG